MSLLTRLSALSARLLAAVHPGLALRSEVPAFRYFEDGLGTAHDSSFVNAPRFQRAYELGRATGSWHDHDLRWRVHVLLWAAACAASLPGAFVECGVYRGGFARAIIDFTDFTTLGREYHLFDTFCGFDEAQMSQREREAMSSVYRYDECFEDVSRTFAAFPFVHLHRGTVPGSLVHVGPVAFLSIDMNCAAPEIAAARFFWPHLLPGALVVLDDYGFTLHHEQKHAFDALATEWQVPILSLPTGQGLIIKPGVPS